MAATWRLKFFLYFFSDFPRNLVYIGFSGSASLLALSVLVCDLKRGYGGHLDFLI